MADAHDDDLDALLDDALDCFDQEEKAEEVRQEERKKERETRQEATDAGSADNMLTNLLETTLGQLKDGGNEEDRHLQDLLEQGLSLIKNEGESDDQEVMTRCMGLLQNIMKEFNDGGADGEGGMPDLGGEANPLMQHLSQAVGDVVQSLQDSTDEGTAALTENPEENKQLMDLLKQLGEATRSGDTAAAAGAAAAAAAGASGDGEKGGDVPPSADELTKQLFQALMGDAAAGVNGAPVDPNASPEDVLRQLSSDAPKALQQCAEDLGNLRPSNPEEQQELDKLLGEMKDTMKDMPAEMASGLASIIASLEGAKSSSAASPPAGEAGSTAAAAVSGGGDVADAAPETRQID